jgi:hypothetical protein
MAYAEFDHGNNYAGVQIPHSLMSPGRPAYRRLNSARPSSVMRYTDREPVRYTIEGIRKAMHCLRTYSELMPRRLPASSVPIIFEFFMSGRWFEFGGCQETAASRSQ